MVSEAKDPFEVRDANWRIATVEKIPPSQRPDTAFRQMYPTDSGIVMIDDLGKADGLGQIEAAALRYDRAGELAVKKKLQHGVSRVGVHPIGRGFDRYVAGLYRPRLRRPIRSDAGNFSH